MKLTAPLVARLVGGQRMFAVEEASTGGFSIASDATFEEGTAYRFRLTSASGQTAVIAAVCRYSRPVESDDQRPTHLVGFQFLPQETRRLRVILGAIAMDAP